MEGHQRRAGASFMDSDAGGQTADEREEAKRLLAMTAPEENRVPPKAPGTVMMGRGDDDDDSDDGLIDPPAPPKPVAPPPRATQMPLAPAPPPKPQEPPRAKPAKPNGKQSGNEKKRARMRAPAQLSSFPPRQDEEDEETTDVPPSPPRAFHRSITDVVERRPVAQEAPAPRRAQPAPVGQPSFTAPDDPTEAITRFNECMSYFMEMIVELTGDNIHAVTAKMSLETFRTQMLAWGGVGKNGDWKEVVTFMVLSVETSRIVINETSQSITQSIKRASLGATELQVHASQASSSSHDESRRREEIAAGAVPRSVRTDAELPDSAVREVNSVPPGMHFNSAPHATSAPVAPRASSGPPQTKHPPDVRVAQSATHSAPPKAKDDGITCGVM
jgi:hypothetical protein